MRLLALVPILAACTTSDPDVPTPHDGSHLRLVVDDYVLPSSEDEAEAMGSDFDHDGNLDNAIGIAISALSTYADIRDDASIRALIGSGQVPSSLEIFGSDDGSQVVGVEYFATPGIDGSLMRGTALADGGFAVGLGATETTLLLPALVDADPTPIALAFTEMQLAPTGSGSYDVRVQGLVARDGLINGVCTSLLQAITADPSAHPYLIDFIDGIDILSGSANAPLPTLEQCIQSTGLANLFAPDVTGPDDAMYVSFGIALRAVTPRNVPPFE
jgi:hypothetical protein